jgi:formylmethanofuran dehydrogenase subunit D
MPLEIENASIENFDEIKETIMKYLGDLKAYYMNKFKMIQEVMSKQDADTDSMNAEFKIIEKITLEKLDVNEKSLEKLEKKYGEILVYVKNKISN